MDERTRGFVRRRAKDRCEYCGLPQDHSPYARFHVEHIVPRSHGGDDQEANLALACDRCNLHKGPNLTGIDPDSDEIAPLFDPRAMQWGEHFQLRGVEIVGLTTTGRTTVRVLNMNAPRRLQLRARLAVRGNE